MIGSLRGTLAARLSDGEIIVDVHGVGYRLYITPGAMAGLGNVGDDVFVYVHTHVREDALVLYGFQRDDERRCFEALLSAHGVGPALALAILSALSPVALATAVLEDDVDSLCLVPGVGKKTAARLLIDMKHRLDLPDFDRPAVGSSSDPTTRSEVRSALLELGYDGDEIRGALERVSEDGGVEEVLRRALRELAAK